MRRKAFIAVATLAVLGIIAGALVAALGQGKERGPVFYGVALPSADLNRLPAFETASECRPSVFSQFVKLDSASFTVASLNKVSAAGMTPFLTLEPWSFRSVQGDATQSQYSLRALIRGDHDAQLKTIAGVLASYGKPVYLRFAHEMNAPWYPWGTANGNTAADYKQAWRHAHELIAAKAPQAKWVWSPNVVQGVKQGPKLATLYPGDDVVDFVGMTGYANVSNRDTTAEQTFGQTMTVLRQLTDKPVILSEVGADGPGKASWLSSLGGYLSKTHDIAGVVYFNTSPSSTGATGTYELTSKDDFARLHDSLTQAEACNATPSGG